MSENDNEWAWKPGDRFWNYRILRYGDGGFGLHEVHYDEKGEPETWTLEPISFTCDEEEGPDGIVESLRMALADAKKRPILPIKETWRELVEEARRTWSGESVGRVDDGTT